MARHTRRRPPIRRLALFATILALTLTAPVPGARALTGTDGLIAIATIGGIEVFDSSGDGSDLHVLIPSDESGFSVQDPAWSPLGQFIAYERNGEVLVARADGTHAHQVSPQDLYAYDPSWSPDGRLTYFVGGSVVIADRDGRHQIVVDPRVLLGRTDVGIAGRPAWTADGRLVLLVAGKDLPESPFIADGDGTNLRRLTFADGTADADWSMSYSWQFSSAGLVAYVVWVPEDDQYWVSLAGFDGTYIYYLDFSGTTYSPGQSARDFGFSPSGQHAVFVKPGSYGSDATGVGLWDLDFTSALSFQPAGGFWVPGEVAGLDWQPRCTVVGTPGDDVLTGTRGPDLICGLGGDDVISGMGGNDVIYAGPGDDAILGGAGNDVVVGGWGADTIEGNRGLDLINSRRDAYSPDSVHGGLGHDVCLHDRADVLASC